MISLLAPISTTGHGATKSARISITFMALEQSLNTSTWALATRIRRTQLQNKGPRSPSTIPRTGMARICGGQNWFLRPRQPLTRGQSGTTSVWCGLPRTHQTLRSSIRWTSLRAISRRWNMVYSAARLVLRTRIWGGWSTARPNGTQPSMRASGTMLHTR